MNKLYDYLMEGLENDPINECLDCHYESKDWGEIEGNLECADVVCPKCGSIHYYIKDQLKDHREAELERPMFY